MKYYEDKSDRKMELKLLSLSEDDKLIRECMEQASAFYGCLGKMGVTEILCDRKKAQELGADCQITGIFTGGELTAFACAFEYTGLKRNGRKWLNPGDKEWRQIETLGTNVVVIPLLVGKEKVGRLIELLREQYRDSHLLFRISGEQSEKFQEDLAVVSEKNLKSHRYDAAGENVWLFHFAPQIRMEDTYFEEEILLILPGQEVLLEMGIEEAEVTMVKLTGYEIVRSEKGSAFFRKPGAACEGVLLQCDYEQLLRYQRFINLTNYEEHFEQTDSYLRRQINELASIEYGKDGLSIFDVALLLKVSTPSAEFDKTVGKGIMREILTLIYEYAQTMVLEADLDRIYGKFVLEQFEMFDKNIDWYMDNWKDNFSDYINDLMRIAVSDIERKKLTDIYEEMRKIMKESSKKRG
ncbi:hypothetical protein [[Ruminococcus] lactaris]|uniref:Uncharacterized protein n=1 Tax=[Ruminococcus] lactaris TaxID=46228 RepID=A0A414P1P5_9FIRM|nr:hypothetical protein [[Ruminococcus] lactaris]RHF57527.1 hypothetical protein DW672_11845 [[Ruminococcus] lactaris]